MVNTSTQIERDASEYLLARLCSAIDQAKHAKSEIKSSYFKPNPYVPQSVPWRLKLVDREIELLESKLLKIRGQISNS